MSNQPPKYALRFLRWFCREDFLDEIEGDLIELFEYQYKETPQRANWLFIWQVLLHFRPDFIKSFRDHPLIYPGMLKHNLLITYRGFLRNKTSFAINLIGLSTGLACVLMIYLWVNDERSVDRFHEKDSQLYQVMNNFKTSDGIQTWDITPSLMAGAIAEEWPEVEAAVHHNNWPTGLLSNEDQAISVKGKYASANFFDVFSYKLLDGDQSQVLVSNDKIALSASLALKLFDTTKGVAGKTVEWKTLGNKEVLQVTGVYEDPPVNATQQFDFVLNFDRVIKNDPDVKVWSDGYVETVLVLKENTDIKAFNTKLGPYLQSKSIWWDDATLFTKKYSDKYLYGRYEDGKEAGGRIASVRLFSIIALFILLIACINFMNLSTAQASRKMKEIGVKKAIGARSKALVVQFLTESMLITIISTVVAIGAMVLLLPSFNVLTGKALRLTFDTNILLSLLVIMLMTGLLAGSYPAFYLSRFKPLAVLKGKLNTIAGELWVRKGLVVFQFSLSLIFIVGVLVINQQMEYTQTKNLGYHRDNVLSFERPNNETDIETFLTQIKNIPGVLNASNMSRTVLSGNDAQKGYSWRGEKSDEEILFKAPQIGFDMIETLGMEIVEGRSFSREHQDDQMKIIINETALELMQLEAPIGHLLDKDVGNGRETRQIVGVVKDFHYGSIHEKVEPLVLRLRTGGQSIVAKIKAGTEKESIQQIESTFKAVHPEDAFTFTFLDDDYQKLYLSEQRTATLSKYFGAMAILISCLGLFGLAAFNTERRAKEIGIRKVLGSSVWGIVTMLSSDFIKMTLIAILVALPFSYWLAIKWLDNFYYKISLDWSYFALAAGLTLVIAWSTIAWQTLKAARLSPMTCLRDE